MPSTSPASSDLKVSRQSATSTCPVYGAFKTSRQKRLEGARQQRARPRRARPDGRDSREASEAGVGRWPGALAAVAAGGLGGALRGPASQSRPGQLRGRLWSRACRPLCTRQWKSCQQGCFGRSECDECDGGVCWKEELMRFDRSQ